MSNPLTPLQIKRRAQWKQLVRSLQTPQYTQLNTVRAVNVKPGVGAFATS